MTITDSLSIGCLTVLVILFSLLGCCYFLILAMTKIQLILSVEVSLPSEAEGTVACETCICLDDFFLVVVPTSSVLLSMAEKQLYGGIYI